ncbi:MAG: nitrogen regulation protein NR(I) [Gammaproteobacteria bacterium]|nr:MAG: nitrogen regulation protein NR(I) [Gammaproteobacteria bacterium]
MKAEYLSSESSAEKRGHESAYSIWVIDDDRSIRWVLEKSFTNAGMQVKSFENGNNIVNELTKSQPDAIVTDVRMPGVDGMTLIGKIHQYHPEIPIIVITAHSDLEAAVSAYESGAFEYLPKPFDIDEAVELANRACEHSRQSKRRKNPDAKPVIDASIIGEAPSMQEVFKIIGRLSRSNINVLINGQSGTGKELVAKALHKHSPRAEMPFIAINMAAIPRDLLESELFGHEKGSFTGAQSQRKGRFEQADGGTLFLDEIGDMPHDLQTRLLRVLQDGEFYRIGGHTPIKVDVRIVAATHQDIAELVKKNQFREDLFHRLNVIRIHLPPLNQRKEDIPTLAGHFLKAVAEELGTEIKSLSKDVSDFLCNYSWPGNVRQLENVCRWLSVMSSGKEVIMSDLPPELKENETVFKSGDNGWESELAKWLTAKLQANESDILSELQPKFEKILIETTLRFNGGKKKEASELLGWGRNTLTRKIKELNLNY